MRKSWVAAIGALLIASGALGTGFAADSSGQGSDWKQQLRKQEKQQFLRDHSDASGKPRPDLWREGVQQQKQMQVAPYIGWHPKTSSGAAAHGNKQQ